MNPTGTAFVPCLFFCVIIVHDSSLWYNVFDNCSCLDIIKEVFMNQKKKALLCVGIPLLMGICLLIMFGISCILEHPTNRGLIYSILMMISLFGSMLVPIPGIILSTIGIMSGAKLRKHGQKIGYLIGIGILNIIVSIIVEMCWFYIIFVGGAGV